MPVPTNITTADAAINYINSNPRLGVADLQQLALQMNTKVGGNVVAVGLYSGTLGTSTFNGEAITTHSGEIMEQIGKNSPSTAKVATIGQTQASKLLESDV